MTHYGISAIINTLIQFRRRIQLILEDIFPTKSEEPMYVRDGYSCVNIGMKKG